MHLARSVWINTAGSTNRSLPKATAHRADLGLLEMLPDLSIRDCGHASLYHRRLPFFFPLFRETVVVLGGKTGQEVFDGHHIGRLLLLGLLLGLLS